MDLTDFHRKYDSILLALAGLVHLRYRVDAPYLTTGAAAEWLAKNLPKTYTRCFGEDPPKKLKVWRLKVMISTANYLGAFDALDIQCKRGRGLTPMVKPRASKRPHYLRLVA